MTPLDYPLLALWAWRLSLLWLGTALYVELRRVNNRPLRVPQLPEWMKARRRLQEGLRMPVKPTIRSRS